MKKINFNGNKNIFSGSMRSICRQKKVTRPELMARLQTVGVSIDRRAISRIERNLRIVTDHEPACICAAPGASPDEMMKTFYDNFS